MRPTRRGKRSAAPDSARVATLMTVDVESLRRLMADFPFDPMTLVTLGPGNRPDANP